MSDIQIISKLELLPNEILFECFKYLDGVLLFYSFDQLNYRFNKLIRSIPLHLDFRNSHKLLFDQFCKKIMSNDEMKKQIYSLYLSNTNTIDKIEQFLSYFSFDEFPHLRSLTLAKVKIYDVPQLKLMLPLISQLSCFRLIDSVDSIDELFSVLPTSQLRTLKMPYLSNYSRFMHKLSSITNLTVTRCSSDDICRFLTNAPSLKYLKLENVSESAFYMLRENEDIPNHHAIHLKQLIMMEFKGEFNDLVMILKRTPNLTNLTIDAYDNNDMVNASQWEYLFTSSLPYLKIFKFKIQCSSKSNEYSIKKMLKGFQSDFWCKEHHWYTECILSKYSVVIYTIPYIFNTFKLTSVMIRYCNELVNSSNTFDNVTDLTIDPDAITEKCQYHFSYVTSLVLGDIFRLIDLCLNKKYIEHLKMIVNLSNVKHLVIAYNCKLEIPSVLLELLKEAPQVSSLDMSSDVLISLFNDNELCKYLNKMITELNITDDRNSSMDDSCDLNQFCTTFSNIEQLNCKLDQRDSLLFLLKHLPKLSRITTFSFRFTCDSLHWLEQRHLAGRNISDFNHDESKYLSIWFTN